MKAASIDGSKLKEAVNEFGSLGKAIENLKYQRATLSREVSQLKQEKEELSQVKGKLIADIKSLRSQYEEQNTEVQELAGKFGKWERQYILFQGFLAMLFGSPSVTTSLESLISLLQQLAKTGWAATKKADDLRGHFVRVVMGDYLQSFHCTACGAKFMVNNESHYKGISSYYQCPSCHTSYGLKPDDSFLRAMVSEKQLDDIILVEKVFKENEALRPLTAFLDVTCEICGKPIKEWAKESVTAATNGYGWGHGQCWNSELGKMKLVIKWGGLIQKK